MCAYLVNTILLTLKGALQESDGAKVDLRKTKWKTDSEKEGVLSW